VQFYYICTMDIIKQIKNLGNVPFGHDTLLGILRDYRSPNDKISALIAKKHIIAIKRGFYVLSEKHRNDAVHPGLISNLLHGPSYVSLDYALAWHGLLPEAVFETTAVTTKRAKSYDTPLGRFSYVQSFLPLYSIGVLSEENPDGTAFLMASKEKAICDKIVFTPGLDLYTRQAMLTYLEESLRMEADELKDFSLEIVEECVRAGRKSRQLQALYELIKQIQCS